MSYEDDEAVEKIRAAAVVGDRPADLCARLRAMFHDDEGEDMRTTREAAAEIERLTAAQRHGAEPFMQEIERLRGYVQNQSDRAIAAEDRAEEAAAEIERLRAELAEARADDRMHQDLQAVFFNTAMDRAEAAEAERDRLRERNLELEKAWRGCTAQRDEIDRLRADVRIYGEDCARAEARCEQSRVIADGCLTRATRAEARCAEWRQAALIVGERLDRVGPDGYYEMTAQQWSAWALAAIDAAIESAESPPHDK